MLQVQGITADTLQQQTLILPSGSPLTITMYFIPMQQGWFFTGLVYGTFTLNGLRISNLPNMLYQWRNILPFGIGCFSTDNREPSLQTDFLNGNSNLYVLTQAEVQEYAGYLSGANTLV